MNGKHETLPKYLAAAQQIKAAIKCHVCTVSRALCHVHCVACTVSCALSRVYCASKPH